MFVTAATVALLLPRGASRLCKVLRRGVIHIQEWLCDYTFTISAAAAAAPTTTDGRGDIDQWCAHSSGGSPRRRERVTQ